MDRRRQAFSKRVPILAGICLIAGAPAFAQSVCLPAPRLLTIMPMGGQVGTSVEVTINGENLEDADLLSFSHPGITAVPKVNADGQPIADLFVVTIAADCPPGVHEARVMTRLGVSSSRIFNVDTLPEMPQTKGNTSVEKAMTLAIGSICNAAMTKQAVDHYSFTASAGQRIIVDCAARGIDSKMNPVLIVADAEGNDLLVDRRGGAIDFKVPADEDYIVKVHDLTFNGGPHYFYRLLLKEAAEDETISRPPSTQTVSAHSWPPHGLADEAETIESEPNSIAETAQQIALPCDLSGEFYPAADVDTFEFTAKKGEVWWVEVASERLGRPTDPAIVVQHVSGERENETRTDVVELSDIASPVKVSSNGYSYDGPPYNAGSTDILGKLEIKEDGLHRLQLHDLFGGTRSDPENVYRLIVRRAQPDFALVAWALHMNLRNGDRNALSKPIALRGGATMPLEVVAIRRDGFDGEINLFMENLPEGVTAAGLKIPAGQSRGIMLVSANENAPRGLTSARFFGRATINGDEVTRPCQLASMAWPVPNAWSEIPAPRLLADVPVSVCASELAPLTLAAAEDKVFEVTVGGKLTIPLAHTRRCDFSGANISLKTFGAGFDGNAAFDAPLDAVSSEAVLDTAAQKTPPGDYEIAFYGSAVAKYRYNPEAITVAETALKRLQEELSARDAESKTAADAAAEAPAETKAEADKAAASANAKLEAAKAAVTAAEKRVRDATTRSKPKDIVDIIVSKPIKIRVNPAEQP